jgi:hypothetical protein
MRLDDTKRLVWLIDEQRHALKRANSLMRRILKLLADNPDDSALTTTTLAHLDSVLAAYADDALVSLRLARREHAEPADDDLDDAYDPATPDAL